MKEQKLVLDAVRQTDVSKKQGILQKLFAVWFDAFVYNQIWEDPRVDLRALELDNQSRVLTISSGGCNALNYLLESPQSVTAVDLNRHHVYLLNLKHAAVKTLPGYEDFFNFFGFGKHKDNLKNYHKYIAPHLDEETRRFWGSPTVFGRISGSRRIDYFQKGGLYEHSRNGYFLRFFHKFARMLGCRPDQVLKANTSEEQEALFQKHISPFFDSFIIKSIGKLPVTMFGLGIPPQQYEELVKDLGEGGTLIDMYRERAHRLAVKYPIDENYFAWQAFSRKYDTAQRQAVPEYLKQDNYESLKANAGRLQTSTGSVTDQIIKNPQNAYNRFVFLDAQDWMNPQVMTELWAAVSEKAESGSRIIFRTAGAASPIEKNLPEDLRKKFVYKKEASDELFKADRASIYGGFHLYILK